MERNTTQETLENMRKNVDNFNAEDWAGEMTVNELKERYIAYKYVAETLNMNELRLLALLRGCHPGEIQRFLNAAKKLYDAYEICQNLSDITLINK